MKTIDQITIDLISMKNNTVFTIYLLCVLSLAACTFQVEAPSMAMVAGEPSPGAPGIGDPFYPLMGNGGYDAQHYTIDLLVHMPTNHITGTTTIEAIATQDLSVFNLDLSGLEIGQVVVDDQPAEFSRAETELTITPTLAIASGADFVTNVAYSGSPTPINDPAVPFTEIGWLWDETVDVVWVVSEPSGAMSWYPSNNHPQDKATYSLRITVAKPYVVAANGILEETIDNGDATTFVWQMRYPMATYLTTVAIGEFERMEEEGPDGLPLRYYFPLGTTEELMPAFAPTGEMLAFFSEMLGPYPFNTYGGVVIPLDLGYALETQTMPIFGQNATSETTVAHELMHQWLGNDVTPATWQDIWLNEGFSGYFQFLWLEHKQGAEVLNTQMEQFYQVLVAGNIGPPANISIGQMFGAEIYVRGAVTLHALRLQVGDETFFEILKTYYQRFQHRVATTEDFITVAAEVSEEDSTDLLNAWLYEEEVPPWPAQN